MKFNGSFSDWLSVPAGVPQGTCLGPWLFLVMINDLKLPEGSFLMWKFAGDTAISEVISPSQQSSLQYAVDYIAKWSQENRLQLNPTKYKEVQTCFKKSPPSPTPVGLHGFQFEIVNSAKVLGVTIRDDFEWNDHTSTITIKAAERLYLLRQLIRAGVSSSDLVQCSTVVLLDQF